MLGPYFSPHADIRETSLLLGTLVQSTISIAARKGVFVSGYFKVNKAIIEGKIKKMSNNFSFHLKTKTE